jgi:hypothetical protein
MTYLSRIVLAALLLVPAACASGGGTAPAREGAASVNFRCGQRIEGSRPDGMEVGGRFPPALKRGGDGMFSGTVTATATGARITGVASPEADVYLARDAMVVATALPKDSTGRPVDLAAGATFTARGSLRSCAPGGDPLPAGHYQVFAVVLVVRDDGSSVSATGGPWPLDVA